MIEPFQPTILRFYSIDSTNLEAMRQARAGKPEGLCLIAGQQTVGRGRQGRHWLSGKDAGLYFTILLRPVIEMSAWPLITLMSALAVADTLKAVCGISADIKWPNDLIVGDRKICGILCETVETDTGYAVVAGIGINLFQVPDEIARTATSVEQETKSKPDSESVLNELINALASRYAVLQSDKGLDHTIREWCARSSYAKGKRVRVDSGAAPFEGVTDGLESDGALRVVTANGEVRIVRAGDVQSIRDQGRKQ